MRCTQLALAVLALLLGSAVASAEEPARAAGGGTDAAALEAEASPAPTDADADGAEGAGAADASEEAQAAGAPSSLEDDYDPLFDEEFEDEELDDGSEGDPWEGMNRGIFAFNQFLDRWFFDPVTDAYQFVFPQVVREGVYNAFLNLQTPVLFLNHLMQLRGEDAMITLGRFVVNSTAGGAGFFDAAGRGAGLERRDADFGQTLGFWGTPPGPYLMLPILGPSTVRDTTGVIVDRGMDPLTWLIGPAQLWIPIASQGLATRDANHEDLRRLKEGSLDFYAALRSAYLQSREAAVREARGVSKDADSAAPDAAPALASEL